MSKPVTVLIVDDDPFNRDLLEQELTEMELATVSVSNGQEALNHIALDPPDLVLLDVMMPVLDGFETCRILKTNEQTCLIPVIIMTALDATEDRITGIEAGADDFLTKPVDDRELKARINTALKQKQAIDGRIGRAQRVSEHYAKFVPETVKKLVASNPEAPDLEKRDRDVSVLFADISGYTHLSEKLPRDALLKIVEIYFAAYIDHVQAGRGDVCSTAGDGLMAIFHEGSPKDHAVRAAETALSLQAATSDINRRLGEEPIDLHIGLNAGVASFGATRYEGLRGRRWVFTADGMVVNVASRIADCAEPREILLGPVMAKRLEGHFAYESVGKRSMKNIDQPIEIFRLVREVG